MIRQHAQQLRINASKAENTLWYYLRNKQQKGCKFRRQHVIEPYIVDFACLSKRLIIEVDGDQHAWQKEYDADRTTFLELKGFKVLRFWNKEVLTNIGHVVETIGKFL